MSSRAEERLREILAKVLLADETEINDGTSQRDLETWDSMAHLMLVSEVESAFGVMMSDEDITGIKTVGDLKSVLRKLGLDI